MLHLARTVRACLWLALLLIACSGAERRPAGPPLPPDEDLLALLPAGLDAVLLIETPTLRALPTAGTLYAELPASARAALGQLAPDPLRDLDALAVGLVGLGTEQVEAILVGRGRIARLHLFQQVGAQAGLTEYHGVTLCEGRDGRAAALLSERTAVLGPRVAVRRVIDNFHGDSDGARGQPELAAALAHAPRAVKGQPAVRLALLPTPPLRERLRQADLADLFADADYVAASLASGDGIDLGVVAGYRHLDLARETARRMKERAADLGRRPAMRLLGLLPFLEPLIVVGALARQKDPELHIAYRLTNAELHDLLQRIENFRQLRDRIQKERRQ
jgi:hypothetical protein